MTTPVIPNTYEQWKHCITIECGIPLNKAFIETRITSLTNRESEAARQFIRLYGESHYQNVLVWMKQAQRSLQ